MVVEPGGSTLLGIVVVVVVGWTIVGLVVLVVLVGRAITGVVVDEPMAANPMSSSQSLAELPSSQESDGRSSAAIDAGVTTEHAAPTHETQIQPMTRGDRARARTDSIVRSGMLGLPIMSSVVALRRSDFDQGRVATTPLVWSDVRLNCRLAMTAPEPGEPWS